MSIVERLESVAETGCDPDLPHEAAEEIRRLRDVGRRVIAAFEALGKTREAGGMLAARARCESVMLELQHVLDTPK